MSFNIPRRLAALLALALTLAGYVTVQLVDDNGDGRPDRVHVEPATTATLQSPAGAPVHVPLTAAEVTKATPDNGELAQLAAGDIPLSDSTPNVAGVDEAQTKADNAARADDQTYDTSGVLKGGTAEPAHLTCHTPGHGAARVLSAIRLGVVHVTVSPNVFGIKDVAGLCGYFAGQKLSATWIVDNEGNSAENQPLGITPWTQAFYNTYSCSIEFVGYTGRPGQGASSWTDVQYREGARLMAQCFKKAGVPVQRAIVTAGGHIQRAGVITHQELGILGGGHSDPGPKFHMSRFMALLKAYATTGTSYIITATDRTTCRKLNWWRQAHHPHGKPEKNAVRRREALAARHVLCTATGPRRA
jgi:hypothetical protein